MFIVDLTRCQIDTKLRNDIMVGLVFDYQELRKFTMFGWASDRHGSAFLVDTILVSQSRRWVRFSCLPLTLARSIDTSVESRGRGLVWVHFSPFTLTRPIAASIMSRGKGLDLMYPLTIVPVWIFGSENFVKIFMGVFSRGRRPALI